MSRVDPSPQQPQAQSGDLALNSGVGRAEAEACDTGDRLAQSILTLVGTMGRNPRVYYRPIHNDRVIVGVDAVYCAICLDCHEVIGLADSARAAETLFCRVCDEVKTARIRGGHVLSRLLALRHGLSIDQPHGSAASGISHWGT